MVLSELELIGVPQGPFYTFHELDELHLTVACLRYIFLSYHHDVSISWYMGRAEIDGTCRMVRMVKLKLRNKQGVNS